MKEYRVYMLENLLARRYIGLSEDVNIRLADHNSGKSKYTAKHGPLSTSLIARQNKNRVKGRFYVAP